MKHPCRACKEQQQSALYTSADMATTRIEQEVLAALSSRRLQAAAKGAAQGKKQGP